MRMGESLGAEHPLRLATALRVVLPRRDRAVPAGRADLHVHSIWSDGAQAPAAIVRAAAGRVDVLAITDHPNAPPPSDAILLTSGVRRTEDPSARYAEWL